MKTTELITAVEASGRRLWVAGEYLAIKPPALPQVRAQLIENKQEIIILLLEREAAPWRDRFERWLKSACISRPRDFAGLNSLLISFWDWAGSPGNAPFLSRDAFRWLLAESGFVSGDVRGATLVAGLMLTEDVLANEQFQQPRQPPPAKRRPHGGRND